MTLRRLLVLLGCYVLLLSAASLLIARSVRLRSTGYPAGSSVVTVWQHGVRRSRSVVAAQNPLEHVLKADGALPGATRIVEKVAAVGDVFQSRLLFGASFVIGRDGVSASYQGRSALLTPDDLRKLEAYQGTAQFGPFTLPVGIDVDKVLAALAAELEADPALLLRHGRLRRFRVTSNVPLARPVKSVELGREMLRGAVLAAAAYLVRNQHPDGSFSYEIDAVTGVESSGYNLPRHAGATYFLARVANRLQDLPARAAAVRAGAWLRENATLRCGAQECIGTGEQVDVGSSALALLADVELVAGGSLEFRDSALSLAGFLRRQQRPDGEFQHRYSVTQQHPIDVQFEYFTGEAAFALARVARISGDARDLAAASHALAFLVQRSPLFLGARYFWGSEHWTCQALDELWSRAPDYLALDFCLRWQAATRELQLEAPPAPSEYDGALNRGPFVAPRLIPLASRLEAAAATLSVVRASGSRADEAERLERELQRGLAFLLRYQFGPGLAHLMPNASQIAGGFPATPVDLHVRIDAPQHAGCALLRYWELSEK